MVFENFEKLQVKYIGKLTDNSGKLGYKIFGIIALLQISNYRKLSCFEEHTGNIHSVNEKIPVLTNKSQIELERSEKN